MVREVKAKEERKLPKEGSAQEMLHVVSWHLPKEDNLKKRKKPTCPKLFIIELGIVVKIWKQFKWPTMWNAYVNYGTFVHILFILNH